MTVVVISPHDDRAALEELFDRDPGIHLYELGDLDPRYAPLVTYLGRTASWRSGPVLMRYNGAPAGRTEPMTPVLVAMTRQSEVCESLVELVLDARACGQLPETCYGHLAPEVADGLEREGAKLVGRSRYWRMVCRDPSLWKAPTPTGARFLRQDDLPAIETLLARAYPGNSFEAAILDTDMIAGAYDVADGLIAMAGVHIASWSQNALALGNICTHPDHRGRGLAHGLTALVCRRFAERQQGHHRTLVAGLNVRADNRPAITCYERLGFRHHGNYDEVSIRLPTL